MSIEAKIDQCVDIWIDKGSLSPGHKKQKFNEIFGKIQSGALTEHDLDVFIEGWKPETGKYINGN